LRALSCQAIPTREQLLTKHKQLQSIDTDTDNNNNNNNSSDNDKKKSVVGDVKPKKSKPTNAKDEAAQRQARLFARLSQDPIDLIDRLDKLFVPNRAYPSDHFMLCTEFAWL
jgi:hypothetical protein